MLFLRNCRLYVISLFNKIICAAYELHRKTIFLIISDAFTFPLGVRSISKNKFQSRDTVLKNVLERIKAHLYYCMHMVCILFHKLI